MKIIIQVTTGIIILIVGSFILLGQIGAAGSEHGAWLACQNAALAEIGSVSAQRFPYLKDSVVTQIEPGQYWVRFVAKDANGTPYLWSCTAKTIHGDKYQIEKLYVNPPLPS